MKLASLLLWEDRTPRGGALNMALDESMLLQADEPWLRVYRWDAPSVSIGFSQREDMVPETQRAWPVVRRWTGGGVVVHDGDWTYTLAIPAAFPHGSGRTSETYRWIHQAMIDAFRKLDITDCALQDEHTSDGMGVCFVEPARFDVVRGGQKVAGAAQRRARMRLLHQGSVQPLKPPHEFARVFAEHLAVQVRVVSQTEAETALLEVAMRLAETKYSQPSWLHERRSLAE